MVSLTLLHPARRRRVQEIAARNPDTDWQDIYRNLVLWEFPVETRGGFQVAFYRPEAVPRMAEVLAGTGHIKADPGRRTLDTGIVILEVIEGGVDSPRGQKMVRLLRALHDRPDILQEDLTYVLCSLMVVPTRFINRVGWRKTLEVEQQATWRFWCELGNRIGVDSLPGSYRDAEDRFDRYEAENLAASVEGRQLTRMIIDAFASWTPRLLRSRLPEITSALIDDRRFSDALGLPPARRATTTAIRALYKIRRVRQRLAAPNKEPGFVPGQSVGEVYPSGYSLNGIGPYATHQRTIVQDERQRSPMPHAREPKL